MLEPGIVTQGTALLSVKEGDCPNVAPSPPLFCTPLSTYELKFTTVAPGCYYIAFFFFRKIGKKCHETPRI